MGNGLSRTNYIALDYNDLKETNLNDYAQLACALRNSYIESVSDEYFEGTEDGWQVRRHQKTAYAIIALGCKGTIAGFDIDTTGFMETSPSHVTVEGYVENQTEGKWITLLPNVSIQMNSHNFFKIEHDLHIYSRLKLTTAPGGGIARFRCYGQVFPVWSDLNHEYNLASANLGAQIVRWTDVQHCNKPNILLDNGFLT
ncbi:hypothetical protein G6F56_010859 [Rhizopus delemar]|nr:hypothetical protein G6F56_010859 [Rhizopus delemar]